MADLVLRSITKKYGNTTVIDKLDLEVKSGEFVTLLGPSGCGKTTLLRMIAGLETIENGELFIGGKNYNNTPPQKRRIAMVFQSYALFPHMSVMQNIIFGLRISKAKPDIIKQKLSWVVPLLHLKGLEDRLPREISGGQRQRVALARALVLDPDVLLLDEPLSNLDAALRETAIEELKRVHRHVGKTIIYVTHNQVEAMTMSERIALLNAGRIEQYDKPKLIYDFPKTVFCAEFIGSPPINFVNGEICVEQHYSGVKTEIGFLKLDRERTEKIHDLAGKKVLVGIRPQSIYFIEHLAQRRHTDTHIALTVELVENLGDRSLVVGRCGDGPIVRFIMTREEDVLPERKMTVFVDGRRIHLFDPLTRLNIFRENGTI
ncbi:MAG TPA: ABC transporter ATP-binding protein [Chitinispirillaceae bacterium]|nr:ABC transporter ATP-binding protein [Chitinispirillaceae bacterium]